MIVSPKPKEAIIKNLQSAYKFEQIGEYLNAFECLREFWAEFYSEPIIDNTLSDELCGEIFLRCGAVAGYLGTKGFKDAQEVSKNFLTKAKIYYSNNEDKLNEIYNFLALAYWRTGEINEARIWLSQTRYKTSSDTFLHSIIIESLLYLAENNDKQVINFLLNNKKHFTSENNILLYSFYNNLGIAYQKIGEINEAICCLKVSDKYALLADHKIYQANIQNTLANIYKKSGQFLIAENYAKKAIGLYKKINDYRESVAIETYAQILFERKEFDLALENINLAIKLIQGSDNYRHLIEFYVTKIDILIKKKQFTEALKLLSETCLLANTQTDQNFADAIYIRFAKLIEDKSSILYETKESNKFLLPSVMQGRPLKTIKVRDTSLKSFNVEKDSYLIVDENGIERGQLIAIYDEKDTAVVGYYDNQFGLVGIENDDGVSAYNENEVEILGKVIGVADGKQDIEGKLIVKEFKQ